MELYNNKILDLIELQKNCKKRNSEEAVRNKQKFEKRITVQKDKVTIENLQSEEIHDVESFEKVLKKTQSLKQVASNNVNSQSSRSHIIYRFCLEYQYSQLDQDMTQQVPVYKTDLGILTIVDLAGSERLKNIIDSSGDSVYKSLRQKEAIEINKSLSSLKRCFEYKLQKSLKNSSNQPGKKPKDMRIPPVDYRSCNLTLCLKEAFESA